MANDAEAVRKNNQFMSARIVTTRTKHRGSPRRSSDKPAEDEGAAKGEETGAVQVDVAQAGDGSTAAPSRKRVPRPPRGRGGARPATPPPSGSANAARAETRTARETPAAESEAMERGAPAEARRENASGTAFGGGERTGDGPGRRRVRGRRGGRGRGRTKNGDQSARVGASPSTSPVREAEAPSAFESPSADELQSEGSPRGDELFADDDASVAEVTIEGAEVAAGPTESATGGSSSARLAARRDGRGGDARRRGPRGRGRDARSSHDEEPEEIVVGEDDEGAARSDGAAREMIINVSTGEECRIALLQDGRLEELFIERTATQSHVGNIYKGRVTNVEPSIQAAFVDFGLPKNGFLHVSDVQPQYFPHAGESEDVGRKIPRHHRPPIQKCFRRGQEVIVQITKEGVGTKGPTLTTYLSIPGRFLVMMPGMSEVGVSRKIEDETVRRKMRQLMSELELPSGMGFILRTAGVDRTKRELQRDLHYLQRLWRTVVERVKRNPAPAELYRESDLVIRSIRDVYSADFQRIVVDDAATAERVREFLQIAMPRSRSAVDLYTRREPIFHHFGIEAEIERINSRHVPLKSGGSLVIDTTEAMVAIDVNSGRFRAVDDAEESAFKINLEAAEEIARQLRLRDLGGLIVCDFIDMRMDRHKRGVERALRDALRKHKERARLLRMSAFGLIEMTRQRQGPSLKRNIYYDCPHCRGSGLVKMPESVILDVMRIIQLAAHHDHVRKITVSVASDVAYRLLNKKRAMLAQIEAETGKSVVIRGDANFTSDQIEFVCEDERGQVVPLGSAMTPESPRALPNGASGRGS